MDQKFKEMLNNGFNEYEKYKDVIRAFFEDLVKPISLEQCNAIFSRDVDKLIAKQKKQGDIIVGGVFSYVVVDENHFKVGYELYTQNVEKKFFKHKGETELINLSRLVVEDQEKLKEQKKLEFEIEDPDEEKGRG